MTQQNAVVSALLKSYGTTYAQDAGITLRDKPSPLYRLQVLSLLLSARIGADLAVAAARELFAAGFRTPKKMCESDWQARVDALGRGHYRRYDERTATMLGDGATMLLDEYGGDLRKLRDASSGPEQLQGRLQRFPGIGPTGTSIFCREAQAVWPELVPFVDRKVLEGASRLGLPDRARELAQLVDPADLSRLAAACVRAALRKKVADDVLQAAGRRPSGAVRSEQ